MRISKGIRATARTVALVAVAASLSACLGPTYGTDKSSTEQLVDDISNMATIKPDRGPAIDYKPRPALVRPPETANLPQPQQSVAAENPNWVESPEDSRNRLIAEADANRGDFAYRSPLARAGKPTGQAIGNPRLKDSTPTPLSVMRQERANKSFRENLKIKKGAYSDRRRFLSDPPLDYRKPAETAAVGELGEPEKQKERERIAAATKKKGFKLPKFSLPW